LNSIIPGFNFKNKNDTKINGALDNPGKGRVVLKVIK